MFKKKNVKHSPPKSVLLLLIEQLKYTEISENSRSSGLVHTSAFFLYFWTPSDSSVHNRHFLQVWYSNRTCNTYILVDFWWDANRQTFHRIRFRRNFFTYTIFLVTKCSEIYTEIIVLMNLVFIWLMIHQKPMTSLILSEEFYTFWKVKMLPSRLR